MENLNLLKIGPYTLSRMINYKGEEKLWIEHDSGEAMEMDVDKFYKENF